MNIGIFYSLYGISKIKKKNTKEKPNKKDKFFYIFAFVLILLGWFLCITDIIYKNITKDYESTAINLGFGLCFTGLIILLFYHIYTFSKNINIDEKNHDHQNKSE
jgi:amino acid transporter